MPINPRLSLKSTSNEIGVLATSVVLDEEEEEAAHQASSTSRGAKIKSVSLESHNTMPSIICSSQLHHQHTDPDDSTGVAAPSHSRSQECLTRGPTTIGGQSSLKSKLTHKSFLSPFGGGAFSPLRPSVSTHCLFSGCNDETTTSTTKPSSCSTAASSPETTTATTTTSGSSTSKQSGNTSMVCVPTRASLTHEWRKLKTPNKCRECNLLVYFNGRECSCCGFVAHKKCIMVLVIKCSRSLVTTTQQQTPTTRRDLTGALSFSFLTRTNQNIHFFSTPQQGSQQVKLAQPTPIFGQPIGGGGATGERLVDFINRFVYEIDTRGLTSKGIYRVSSIKSKVDKLCHYYDQNHSNLIDLSSFHPNIIANALKMYLRRLPEPLLTHQLYAMFIELAKKYPPTLTTTANDRDYHHHLTPATLELHRPSNFTSTTAPMFHDARDSQRTTNIANTPKLHHRSMFDRQRGGVANDGQQQHQRQQQQQQQQLLQREGPSMIEEFRQLISMLPKTNRDLVSIIMRHLRRVADLADENQMSEKNLSIIFGPTLLSTADNKSLAIVDNIHQARVVELMITWAYQIFPLSQGCDPDSREGVLGFYYRQ